MLILRVLVQILRSPEKLGLRDNLGLKLCLIESWLGKENVWPVNKSILRKKVPKGNQLWGAVFSKLEFFNLTMFDKVIALDNDILIRRNIEHWFDLPAPAATQERGSIEWNSWGNGN